MPNLIPIVLNFGLMGYLGVPLNPGTAMVAAIAIGVAVDDTIHLMTRFGTESKRHVDEVDAVRATVRGEAVPIVSTSIALALGFGALSLSNFSIVAQFGLLAATTMIYAAVADLLIMPILLKHLRLLNNGANPLQCYAGPYLFRLQSHVRGWMLSNHPIASAPLRLIN